MGTLAGNSCHGIRTNYLGVLGDVMGKHGEDELTRDHAVWCIRVGRDNSGLMIKGLKGTFSCLQCFDAVS